MEKFKPHNLTNKKTRLESGGYIDVLYPEHPAAVGRKYVKLHRLLMENILERFLLPHEIIHHKDFDKLNNNPTNLQLCQSTKEHHNLHRTEPPTVNCKLCNKLFTITERPPSANRYSRRKYCSYECGKSAQKIAAVAKSQNRATYKPTKEELTILIWEKPTTHVAKDFGVSDKAIEKWCKKYQIEKPPRGYWAKQKAKQK